MSVGARKGGEGGELADLAGFGRVSGKVGQNPNKWLFECEADGN